MIVVVFNLVVELKVSVFMDKVKRYCREVNCREISFIVEGSVARRHKYFAETPRSWLVASSKVVAALIWLVWSRKERFKMYL